LPLPANSPVLELDPATDELGKLLAKRQLIVMGGAGISIGAPSNLPSWDELLALFIDFCRRIENLPGIGESDRLDPSLLNEATDQARRYPTRVASVLRDQLKAIDARGQINVSKMFTNWLVDLLYQGDPNDNHKAIVNTDYPYILTTNYDRLFEKAAEELGFLQLNANSYTFMDAEKVAGAIYSKIPAIIHIHGDAISVSTQNFVFTASDYVRVARDFQGFTLSLQTLMMSYSILFVGYGGSDPHLEELLEEICYFLQYSDSRLLPRFYVVLKRDKVGGILKAYKDKLRTTLVVVDEYVQAASLLRALSNSAPRRNSSLNATA
jgi:hypothetical protein